MGSVRRIRLTSLSGSFTERKKTEKETEKRPLVTLDSLLRVTRDLRGCPPDPPRRQDQAKTWRSQNKTVCVFVFHSFCSVPLAAKEKIKG